MEEHDYNKALCDERHKNIEDDMLALKSGLNKVNNRFIVLLTMLSMNLLGVAVLLMIKWLEKG